MVVVGREKPEVVSLIRSNGEWVCQEELPAEEIRELTEQKIDAAMRDIGFERVAGK